ncbi:MAG TPA: GNAT family N-acetyltransferase [Candidatus Norongarragalinales archaeon]|nr:GNAT family N-acetyltransferase [Candidatus Norongarragalinales archaeon]
MFEILFLIGLIALVGFVGRWAYERTRIQEAIILIAIGFVLGPLGFLSNFVIFDIDITSFRDIAPLVSAVAIISLVFDAGLRLKLEEIFKTVKFSTVYALANLLACIIVLTGILHYGFGWTLFSSLLLGAILGGPSLDALYSILPYVRASNNVRNILYFEGTLSTVLICIIAITTMRHSAASSSISDLLLLPISSFSVSLVLGFVGGISILWALHKFKIRKFGYLLTLSALLVLYYVDFELLDGIGVLSIAMIGLVIGNSDGIFRFLRVSDKFALEERPKGFEDEISLIINTFFFVYLGLIVDPSHLASSTSLGVAFSLMAGILAARFAIIQIAKWRGHSQHNENTLLLVMVPRDLLSVTLAMFALSFPLGLPFDVEIILIIIVLSAAITAFGTIYYERKFKSTFLFRKELALKDGRRVVLHTVTRDDFPKVRQFLNDLVKEGALIAFDQYVNPIEEKEMGRESLEKINSGEAIMWVCEYGNKVVARAVAARMERREKDNVSLSLYVAREFRGVGLGTTLLRMLIAEAQGTFKPHNLYLEVFSNNENAIRIYKKEGFVKIGVLPGWNKYGNSYLDEIYMVYKPKKGKAGK